MIRFPRLFGAALLGAIGMGAVGVAGYALAAPVRYSVTCTTLTNTALSTTSETVFAATANRKKLCIVNGDSAIAVHVKFGATATTADAKVSAGGSICETVEDGHVYTGVVDAIAASGTPAISGFQCE